MKNYKNLVAIIFAGCLLAFLIFIVYNQTNKNKVETKPQVPSPAMMQGADMPSIKPPTLTSPAIQ